MAVILVDMEQEPLRLVVVCCSFKCPFLFVRLHKEESKDSLNMCEEFDSSWWNVHCLLWLIQKSQQTKSSLKVVACG